MMNNEYLYQFLIFVFIDVLEVCLDSGNLVDVVLGNSFTNFCQVGDSPKGEVLIKKLLCALLSKKGGKWHKPAPAGLECMSILHLKLHVNFVN